FTTVKTTSTPIEHNKALIKDAEAEDVDVHLYRSMIGSLMYLIASRPDIMFAVYACARFQVTPKTSHLHAVKRIFRYLKGQPKLGLWYPRDSPFDLEAFSYSDYARASLHRKSTTGDENTRKSVIEQHTYKQAENFRKSHNSRSDKRNWNGMITQKLKDGLRRNFIPTAVITNSGKVPVNTAKQSSLRAVSSTSTARYVHTAATRPTMNNEKPSLHVFHKSHSPVIRTFNQTTTPKNSELKETINTAKVNNVTTAGTQAVVSVVQRNGENAVKFSACWIWRPTGNVIDHISKDSGSYMLKRFNYVDLQGRLKKRSDGLFDIDSLTKSMNYEPVTAGNQTNDVACIEINSSDDKDAHKVSGKGDEGVSKGSGIDNQERFDSSTQDVNTAEPSINTANTNINIGSLNINIVGSNYPSMPSLEETGIFDDVYDDREVGEKADTNNLELSTVASLIPTTRVHKDHPKEQITGDLNLATQTRRMINFSEENYMPMVDLLNGKKAIGTKWVFKNKKDKRGIVVRNKARLVAQGYTQEEGIDYDEVFSPVARIEAIRLFLAYASYTGFIVYQIDVKSAFLYNTIEEEVYVCQPPGFEDPHFVYKVKHKDDGIFINQDKYVADILKKFDFTTVKTTSTPIEHNKALIKDAEAEDVDVLQIFSQRLLMLADLTFWLLALDYLIFETASTLIETKKALLKDEKAKDVDVYLYRLMTGSLMYLTAFRPDIMFSVCACARFQVTPRVLHLHAMKRTFRYLKGQPKLDLWYLYRSMIGSLMYLIASRPDIMFAVYACARFQVTPKTSHLHAVKRIFRYLKGQPKLGLWYPRDSPFDLEAFSYSDYARASLHRKSTTGEYVDAPSCCGQPHRKHKSRRKQRKETEVPCIEPQTEEHIPIPSHDPLPSGEDRMKLSELMEICAKLSDREDASKQGRIAKIDVNEDLLLINETAQDQGRMYGEDFFRINDFDGNDVIADVTAGENVEQDATVAKKEVSAAESVEGITTATTPQIFKDDVTLDQTLIEIKATKPKEKRVTIQEPSEFKTTSPSQPPQSPQAKDKGKGIMMEPEKPLKKIDQITLDEVVARKLKAKMTAEMDEEERI
nr:hypothetical protein [Tanacetum cinerariifolium]